MSVDLNKYQNFLRLYLNKMICHIPEIIIPYNFCDKLFYPKTTQNYRKKMIYYENDAFCLN